MDFLDDKITQHLNINNYDEEFEPEDYVDAFLLEKARMEKDGEDISLFSREQLVNTMWDLWTAGQVKHKFVSQNNYYLSGNHLQHHPIYPCLSCW